MSLFLKNRQNIFLTDNFIFLFFHFHFVASPFFNEYAIANFNFHSPARTTFQKFARTHGHNFTFGFFFFIHSIMQNNAWRSNFFLLNKFDHDVVAERFYRHIVTNKNKYISTQLNRVLNDKLILILSSKMSREKSTNKKSKVGLAQTTTV